MSTWACSACTFENPNSNIACEICGTTQPGYVAPEVKEPPRADGWNCIACTMMNTLTSAKCSACDTPRPNQELDLLESKDGKHLDMSIAGSEYRYSLLPVGATSVQFYVRGVGNTIGDIHVGLLNQRVENANSMHVFVLDGWRNSACAFRTRKAPGRHSNHAKQTQIEEIINTEEFRPFWISWGGDGKTTQWAMGQGEIIGERVLVTHSKTFEYQPRIIGFAGFQDARNQVRLAVGKSQHRSMLTKRMQDAIREELNEWAPRELSNLCLEYIAQSGKIVVTGLKSQRKWIVYDKKDRVWFTADTNLISRRARPHTVTVAGMMYCLGLQQPSSDPYCEMFEPETNLFHPVSLPSPQIEQSQVVAANGSIYMIGGLISNSPTNQAEFCDPLHPLRGWTSVSAMCEPRAGHAVTEAENNIYVFGGKYGQPSRCAERFDTRDQKWVRLPEMKFARKQAAAAYVNGVIYVMGGILAQEIPDVWTCVCTMVNESKLAKCPVCDSARPFSIEAETASTQVEAFSIADNSWAVLEDLPIAMWKPSSVSDGREIFLLGGAKSRITVLFNFNPARNTWTPINTEGTVAQGAFKEGSRLTLM